MQALLLFKLQDSGVTLSDQSNEIVKQFDRSSLIHDDHREEFLFFWHEGKWGDDHNGGDGGDAGSGFKDSPDKFKLAMNKDDAESKRELKCFMRKEPNKFAENLRLLAHKGNWNVNWWRRFLNFLSTSSDLPTTNEGVAVITRMRSDTADTLAIAPRWVCCKVAIDASRFVKCLAKQFEIDQEEKFLRVWHNVWGVNGESAFQISGVDALTYALNQPAGQLAYAAIDRLQKYNLQNGAGFPDPVKKYFDAICQGPEGHPGRVMLALRLSYLFAIEPNWVSSNLICRMQSDNERESNDLWHAYGRSLRVGSNLLAAFKEQFLNKLLDKDMDAITQANLMRIFIAICLESPNELAPTEVCDVVSGLSDSGLKSVIAALGERLRGSDTERRELWRACICPWLCEYWPKSRCSQTEGTSGEILRMTLLCGDAFPDAVSWAVENDYMKPHCVQHLIRFMDSQLTVQFPKDTVKILAAAVDPKSIGPRRGILEKILDRIIEADSTLASDHGFKTLQKIASP